ncbi:GNAT family N-acetyltransferase [Arthrobacter sp. zg-Y40]|uniref:GNAT family N-acetyltransferase n=1 Tax=unclassified Arthrobacter TaxID=235627 RepID=UPI001D14B1A1|nr:MULTISPECIES: GNAT family N-acetyltransferase [unclassified Arthrobacter]MCC3280042.1 GNAT family N-acetyltransferase [Arthrobacter sp. zg-Y40]MCC3277357.1 GNAT family N-acetyltransferase [Arthrobacter sp. zg-Y20]MDK1317517.1 GNAT family N-acetyltransferase [Arthrobacter sp. zg.Y20]MDK1328393.1 GNAT family N-acetyltransferase [Arthrobacter sp. zg-Y1143]WIB06984.1 GNAT family N-acetyltransferase [Arthrobacter sp. zg-Y20]
MQASISHATAEDIPGLVELASLTFPLACPPEVTPEDSAAFVAANLSAGNFTQFLADEKRLVLAARQDGRLVGYCLLVLEAPTDPEVLDALDQGRALRPSAELSKFYVHPDAHGRGIAGQLIDAAAGAAASVGARSMWLGVNNGNVRAQSFYRKSGFQTSGRRSFQVGAHTFRDLIMVRLLTGTGAEAGDGAGRGEQ